MRIRIKFFSNVFLDPKIPSYFYYYETSSRYSWEELEYRPVAFETPPCCKDSFIDSRNFWKRIARILRASFFLICNTLVVNFE